MKKYLKLIVLCGSFLFAALIFATMAGAGITTKLGNTRLSYSVYWCLKDGSAVSIISLCLCVRTFSRSAQRDSGSHSLRRHRS